MASPFGAYWYVFFESTFMAMWSFQPSSSAVCQGVSRLGITNLTAVPLTKHCQAGVGQECDQVRGESSGEDGTGEVLSAAPAAAAEAAAAWWTAATAARWRWCAAAAAAEVAEEADKNLERDENRTSYKNTLYYVEIQLPSINLVTN